PARIAAARPRVAPLQALRARLAAPDAKSTLAGQLADDPDAASLALWLGRLKLLYGVPFVHLVPDARMLPPESVRFFYLDAAWIAAMTEGSLSIGLGSSREVEMQLALTEELEQMSAAAALAWRAQALDQTVPPAAPGPNAGLLVR